MRIMVLEMTDEVICLPMLCHLVVSSMFFTLAMRATTSDEYIFIHS
jgi:hypothetical protein